MDKIPHDNLNSWTKGPSATNVSAPAWSTVQNLYAGGAMLMTKPYGHHSLFM